jgi:hypothetical protein
LKEHWWTQGRRSWGTSGRKYVDEKARKKLTIAPNVPIGVLVCDTKAPLITASGLRSGSGQVVCSGLDYELLVLTQGSTLHTNRTAWLVVSLWVQRYARYPEIKYRKCN